MASRPVIPHPTRGLIRLEPYKYQAALWADRSLSRVVLKARQTGFSQAVALEALHTAIYRPASTILIVSRNLEAAVNVLTYVKAALTTPGILEPPLAPAPLHLTKNAETSLGLSNGSRVLSIAATRSAGRTYAATAVYLDEFAHMPWGLDIYQAVAPTVSRGGRLTVMSTPNGRANPFFLLWQGQWGGSFSKHVVGWWRCPAYNPDGWALTNDEESRAAGKTFSWYGTERPKFTAQQWAQEYGIDFIDSGVAVFSAEDIQRAQDLGTGLAPPKASRRYVTFWDIGRRQDATVGTTLDVSTLPWQVVAFERREGLPYPAIQGLVEARARAYRGQQWVESNGVGDPVIENLNVKVQPWTTTAKSKVQMITALQLKMQKGQLGWPADLQQLTTETLLYQWDDDALIQDCVISLAGAVAAASERKPMGVLAQGASSGW